MFTVENPERPKPPTSEPARRRGRIWCSLTDSQGVCTRYRLSPLPPSPAFLAGWRFDKLAPDGRTLESYLVQLAVDADVSCSCIGHSNHRHCKHASFAVAAGLLPVAMVTELKAALEGLRFQQAQLSAAMAEYATLAKKHQPRKRRSAA